MSSSPEFDFPSPNTSSLPVLDLHDQLPVTGDDEEEQRIDRYLRGVESRATVCLFIVSVLVPPKTKISIRNMSPCHRSSGAIPIITDKIINQLVEMKLIPLHDLSS